MGAMDKGLWGRLGVTLPLVGSHFTLITPLPQMANLGHDALKAVHNKEYEVGCIPCMLYPASGGTLDWTLGEAGIPYRCN